MVTRTVRRLVSLSLAAQDGEYLGSETTLLARLGVSRPTLRQAAKVVENDRLLDVRRGVTGGLYAARPDARHVVQAPALWLRLQEATLDDMNRASLAIIPEAAMLAAKLCDSPDLIAALGVFRDAIEARAELSESQEQTIAHETELARLIGRMSGNPVLMLFTDIAYAFGLLDRDFHFYQASSDRRTRWLHLQRQLCDAILTRDASAARELGYKRGLLVGEWIREDSEQA